MPRTSPATATGTPTACNPRDAERARRRLVQPRAVDVAQRATDLRIGRDGQRGRLQHAAARAVQHEPSADVGGEADVDRAGLADQEVEGRGDDVGSGLVLELGGELAERVKPAVVALGAPAEVRRLGLGGRQRRARFVLAARLDADDRDQRRLAGGGKAVDDRACRDRRAARAGDAAAPGRVLDLGARQRAGEVLAMVSPVRCAVIAGRTRRGPARPRSAQRRDGPGQASGSGPEMSATGIGAASTGRGRRLRRCAGRRGAGRGDRLGSGAGGGREPNSDHPRRVGER